MSTRGFWLWEDDLNARLYEPGTVDKIASLHGKVLGRTVTVVSPTTESVYIRVLPTYSEGDLDRLIGKGLTDVFANVGYLHRRGDYYCIVYGPKIDTHGWAEQVETRHPTLASALRRARKLVDHHARMRNKPLPGWTKRFRASPEGVLASPYPSSEDYDLAAMENEILDEMRVRYDQEFEQRVVVRR
jgi:hypothetical protein